MYMYMYIHEHCILAVAVVTPPVTPPSVELRELEAKLKAGYMNKERAAQLAEKDTLMKKEEVNTLLW